MVPGSQEKSKMKRGFADTSELKATLGSQFQQYLAKVAIASGLADALDRLNHHESQLPPSRSCAGCGVPKTSTTPLSKCKHCGMVEQCSRRGCKGKSNIHDCVVCGKTGLCNGDNHFDIKCVQCNKTVCDDCQSKCNDCPRICIHCQPLPAKQCVRHWLSKEKQLVWETEIGPDILCTDCQIRATQYEAIMTLCQKCNDEFNILPSHDVCKYDFCFAWVCPHDETNEGYCPKHHPMQPPSSTKKSKTELN